LTRDAFVDFLSSSTQALEGVPFSAIHELRRHEYAIETEGYLDDDGFEAKRGLAQERLRSWIHDLKRIYGG